MTTTLERTLLRLLASAMWHDAGEWKMPSAEHDEARRLLATLKGPHVLREPMTALEALTRAVAICDAVALRRPDNLHKDDPRAAYQAAAAKCAWEIRELAKHPEVRGC